MKKTAIIFLTGIISISIYSQEMLTLEKCKELALKNNLKIQTANIDVEIAKQQQKEAFTNYFPSINSAGMGFTANKPLISMDMSSTINPIIGALTPTMIWLLQQGAPLDVSAFEQIGQLQKIEALKNGMIAGVMATQPIFAGGQIINGNKLAKIGVEASQLQKQMSEKEVLLETERCFWQIISLKEKMKTIENSDAMLNQILSDLKISIEAGLAIRNDLLRVELEQNKLASGKIKLENGLKMLKIVLGQKIGISPETFDILQPTEFGTYSPVLSYPDTLALQNRLEYKLLDKSVEAAQLQQKMEIGKNMPTIAIGAGYNYMHFDMNKSDGMKNNFGMINATVSIPITDWWSGSHAIQRKKLELRKAENIRKENSELLLQQMQHIQNEQNEAYHQILLSKKSVAASEENLKINQDNFNAGVSSLSELLEAQNFLQQSRDQYTEAMTEYFIKLAEYKQVNEIE